MFKLIAVLIVACALAACAGQSPAAPSAQALGPIVASSPSGDGPSVQAVRADPGVYALSFHARLGGVWQEVSSLTVLSQELFLRASVTDSSGVPAQQGSVAFEYCSYKKLPPNDITRADEAPAAACDQGLASWKRLTSSSISAGSCPPSLDGSACAFFGVVRIPRDVGFRFRYSPQGSSIAAGTSEERDFTWVAS
jgi:hypothetical protein